MHAALRTILFAPRKADGFAFANAEAAAYVARMDVQPDNARKGLIDALVTALKAAGLLTRIDALWLMAAHTSQAARLNLVAALYDLTAVASPTFTPDRGYAGDGVSSYLNTGFTPSTAAGRHSLNSAHISAWSRTSALSNANMMGATVAGAVRTGLAPRTTGDAGSLRLSSTTGIAISNPDGSGFYVGSRTSATDLKYYPRDLPPVSASVAASGLADTGIRLLGTPSPQYWAGQLCAASIGAGLNDTEKAALEAALTAYLVAVGAL